MYYVNLHFWNECVVMYVFWYIVILYTIEIAAKLSFYKIKINKILR